MIVVNILRNVLEPESVERYETDDLIWLLREQFGEHAPNGARLYHQHVSEYTDVTPTSTEAEERLREMPGPFWLVISPQGAEVWVPLLISAALSAASMVLQMIFAPKLPNAAQRNIQAESPNNGLSARVNRERVNGRIPDVYGTVRSTPDLIAVPYFVFEDHVEIEVAYMCVGRGQYEIHDVRDDTTLVSEIDGASVEVYGPNTSPNSGVPQLQIGDPINRPVLMTKRLGSVNGQVLLPSNHGGVHRAPMRFESPNKILSLDPALDFTEHFTAGGTLAIEDAEQTEGVYSLTVPALPSPAKFLAGADIGVVIVPGDVTSSWAADQIVTLRNANVSWGSPTPEYADLSGVYDCLSVSYNGLEDETSITLSDVNDINSNWTRLFYSGPTATAIGSITLARPSGAVQFNLDGSYEIDEVTADTITLVDPALINAGWDVMDLSFGGLSDVLYPSLYSQGERWIGWFVAESTQPYNRIITNFVNLNGLYADDGSQQLRIDNHIQLEAQRVDQAGVPFGALEQFTGTITGSATSRSTRALTLDVTMPGAAHNRWRFRAVRTNPTRTEEGLQVIDETQWRDLYIAQPVAQAHFGNVTTVQYAAKATDKALALKERKLNLLVTRQIPLRDGAGFTTTLHSTRNAADILCAIALDPRIGNRTIDELDVDGIYATIDEVIDYFGFDEAGEFSYTFDKAEMSFEETVGAVASAVFCQAYRRGSQLRLFFERETDDSSLLFNHRNTLPGSESRTFSFGPKEGYDGVTFEYVSPDDDAVVTVYLPADQSAINPQNIESVGVRNHQQAMLHAWRAWNKILYQHTAMERDCLQEADMLVLGERVLCSDTTRSGEQGGYVVDVDGLTLRLSQPMDWSQPGPHVMFIQNSDGQTEGIPVTSGGHEFLAVLSRPPRVPIVTHTAQPTGYIIGSGSDQRQAEPFITTGKEPLDGQNVRLSAINYDARYYSKDGLYRP